MVQINVKGVPDEVNESLGILAKVFMVNKADVVIRALEEFVAANQEHLNKGRELKESSPLRKG